MRVVLTFGLVLLFLVDFRAQPAPHDQASFVDLVGTNEPGKPFVLEIVVRDLDDRTPISGAEVFVYQTNHKGDYENDASGTARIHGTAYSDQHGKLTFNTIYPRGYNDSPRGEHMHFRISAKGYSPTAANLMFEDYYKKRYDLRNPVSTVVYLDILDDNKGTLCGSATIFLRKD